MKEYAKLFKDECEHWKNKLGINDWRVEYYIDNEDAENRANIYTNLESQTSRIYLCVKWIENSNESKDEIRNKIKSSAKHEIIHLLLAKLSCLANSRYTTQKELYRTEEELVIKLMNIIK